MLLNEHKKPSLTQISWLTEYLKKDENINKHWIIDWNGISKISGNQYYWIKRYIATNQYFKINLILETLKINRK